MSLTTTFALEAVHSQYEQYPFPAYSEANVGLARELLQNLALARFQRVLDIGRGTWLYSNAFALEGAGVTEVDFTSASLAVARHMDAVLGASNSNRRIRGIVL